MDKQEVVNQLNDLKLHCEKFESIEVCEKDAAALDVAVRTLEESSTKQLCKIMVKGILRKKFYILMLICLYVFYLSLKL